MYLHGIKTMGKELSLVMELAKFSLEGFWKSSDPLKGVWWLKMKMIRDLVGAVAFIHEAGITRLSSNTGIRNYSRRHQTSESAD